MKKARRIPTLLFACSLALAASLTLEGQETAANRIPDEDFYLMPAFGEGTVYLRGQGPAQGRINICAVDQSLRFIDDDGTELSAEDADAIIRVQIDTVWFLRSGGAFYRMYPVSGEIGIALRRDTRIVRDARKGAYGMSDRTSSIRQYSTLYTDGAAQQLNRNQAASYAVSETICLYCRDAVFKLSKANLKKIFPDHKDDIDAWFRSGKALPTSVDAARTLISSWLR
jgi:hypothetical protein